MKKYAPLDMGRGTWKNSGLSPGVVADLDVMGKGGGSQFPGLWGTPEKKHETCQYLPKISRCGNHLRMCTFGGTRRFSSSYFHKTSHSNSANVFIIALIVSFGNDEALIILPKEK